MRILTPIVMLCLVFLLSSCSGLFYGNTMYFGNEALGTYTRGDGTVECSLYPDGQVLQTYSPVQASGSLSDGDTSGKKRVEVGDWDLYYGELRSEFIGPKRYGGMNPSGHFTKTIFYQNDPDDPTADPSAYYKRDRNDGVTLSPAERKGLTSQKPYPIMNYHYIDKSGASAISGDFQYASDFHNGTAKVIWRMPPLVARRANAELMVSVIDVNGHYHPQLYSKDLRSKPGLYAVDASKDFFSRWWTVRLSTDRFEKPSARINYGRFGVPTEEPQAFVDSATGPGTKFGFLDSKGLVSIQPKFEFAENFSEGFAVVQNNGRYFYINSKGDEVFDPKCDFCTSFSDGLAAVCLENRWGYIDSKGEFQVKPQFEYAGPFGEGLAPVKNNGRYGFINTTGKFVITPSYFGALKFSEGLAPVLYENGKWGYIDHNGASVIKASFAKAAPFSDGRACVGDLVPFKGTFSDDGETKASQYLVVARSDVGNPNVLKFAKEAIGASDGGKVGKETLEWLQARGLIDALPEAIAAFAKASEPQESHDYAKSEQLLQECMKKYPTFIHSYYGRASCLNKLGKTAEAEALLRQAQKMNPQYTRVYLGFSECEYKKKNYAAALAFAKKALELDPYDYFNNRQVLELSIDSPTAKMPN